jgi:hypothetical protein
LGILGSAADLAAIAAFFIFVLLIGIHAPDAHAMPRTQNSGQAPSGGHARHIFNVLRHCDAHQTQ